MGHMMSKYLFEFGHACENEPHFEDIEVGALARQLIAQIPEREMFSFVRAVKLAYTRICENHAMSKARVFWASSPENQNYFTVDLLFMGEKFRLDGTFSTPKLVLGETRVTLRNVPFIMQMTKARVIGDLADIPFEGFAGIPLTSSQAAVAGDEATYRFALQPMENCANLYPTWC